MHVFDTIHKRSIRLGANIDGMRTLKHLLKGATTAVAVDHHLRTLRGLFYYPLVAMLLEIFKRFKHSYPKSNELNHPKIGDTFVMDHPRPTFNDCDLNQCAEEDPTIPSQKDIGSSHDHPGRDPATDFSGQKSNEWRRNYPSPTVEADLERESSEQIIFTKALPLLTSS